MKDTIFREYDIRGIVDQELTLNEVYDLGKAIATFLHTKYPSSATFIVGRDGRNHSPALYSALTKALCDLGFDVLDVGICPTPAVYFAAHHFSIPTALMITASHNPKEYNGIKLWATWGEEIQAIKHIYASKAFCAPIKSTSGTIISRPIINEYVDYLASLFKHLHNISVNAVIDCANGTAGTVMPQLIKALQWRNVTLLYQDVDGNFPNHEADPTVIENMTAVAHMLRDNDDVAIGLGFDGDCDRMNPMTKQGILVPGDTMLALFAHKTVQTHPGATIVYDIKSSDSLVETLRSLGARPYVAPSGHSRIKQAIADQGAMLAGELSCHFFFKDRYFGYDDGIYAALRTIELLNETGQTLDELVKRIPSKHSSPEIRITCTSDAHKIAIINHIKYTLAQRTDMELVTIDGVRAQTNYGWGLARASNTQPVICLRFESSTPEGLRHVKNDFYTMLSPYFDTQLLKEKIEF